jgi:hypothetical protein
MALDVVALSSTSSLTLIAMSNPFARISKRRSRRRNMWIMGALPHSRAKRSRASLRSESENTPPARGDRINEEPNNQEVPIRAYQSQGSFQLLKLIASYITARCVDDSRSSRSGSISCVMIEIAKSSYQALWYWGSPIIKQLCI